MSPSLEKQYLNDRVSPDMRDMYFIATGEYGSDIEVSDWCNIVAKKGIEKTNQIKRANGLPEVPISTGGATDFYDIGHCKDVDDLTDHWGMDFSGGNCLKALVGIYKGSRHSGTSALRDAKKLQHYANRIVARLEKEQS